MPVSLKAAAIEDHTIEDFDNLFATNVRSPFFQVKELLPLFSEGSSIILVSSLAGHSVPGNPGQPGALSIPTYAATKELARKIIGKPRLAFLLAKKAIEPEGETSLDAGKWPKYWGFTSGMPTG